MKIRLLHRCLALIAAIAAMTAPARASFHFFDIQEVFSNGNGTVQFIELFSALGNQQFIGGRTLTFQINNITQGTVTLSDLPADSTNKTFLIGTANLTTLYGVTPDFVIPANFLSAGANNIVDFAGGTDRVNLALLPTNGTSSLNGQINDPAATSAATTQNAQATPRNFAGQTATIPESTAAGLGLLALGMIVLLRKRN